MKNKLRCILGGLALYGLSVPMAHAIPITIDFTSGTGDNNYTYVEDGFRFLPQAGDHFENNYNNSGEFNWHDGAGNNPPNIITVDFSDGSGNPFAVFEVDVTDLATNRGDSGGIIFSDSNGNSVTTTTPGTHTINFLNTTFLQFRVVNTGINSFPISIDNLDLNTEPSGQVPEPATLALFGIGLAGMGFARRKKKSA